MSRALPCRALAALALLGPTIVRAQATMEVTVRSGETCRSLAARLYGDPDAYDRIHEHNPEMGPPPHRLVPGTVLIVPRPEPPRTPHRGSPPGRAPRSRRCGVRRRARG
ncbi:MAG TPA: LysM domain-containing protein [Sandaracinaceae bacterium]